MSDDNNKPEDVMEQLEHLLTRAARHGAKQVVVDEEFVDKIVDNLETRLKTRFYESVGKNVVKRVAGFLIIGIATFMITLGIKFGIIRI